MFSGTDEQGRRKSQWDFGELFPVETTRKVLTVAELTAQVKTPCWKKQVGPGVGQRAR